MKIKKKGLLWVGLGLILIGWSQLVGSTAAYHWEFPLFLMGCMSYIIGFVRNDA